jgi:hypothetical protein
LSSVLKENEDGFRAYVDVVDDSAWDGVSWEQIREAALEVNQEASVLFIVDRGALEPGNPIQVIDLSEDSRQPFRCIARELWGGKRPVSEVLATTSAPVLLTPIIYIM